MNKKLLTGALVTISSMYLYSHTNDTYGKWFTTEQTALNQRRQQITQKYWDTYVEQHPQHDHTLIKHVLKTQTALKDIPDHIDAQFNKAVNIKNFSAFSSLLATVNDFGLSIIDYEKQLSLPFCYGNFYNFKNNPSINPTDMTHLQQHIKDSNFSGIVSIRTSKETYTLSSPEITDLTTAFSIHSISKIFTEILTLIMIQEGIIQEAWLQQPLRISDSTKKLLPPAIIAVTHDIPLSFDELLRKYIIEPTGMKIFSSQKPTNACYNESGSCSQYICASPAGGHWTTADDLQKFGIWLHKKYTQDVEFKQLLVKYGSEFFNDETEEIHHCGGIGQLDIGQASARFALFLRHGMSIITLSNRPKQAFTMYKTIYHNILADHNGIL